MIAVDTNVIAYLLLPGPHSAAVESLRVRDPEWVSSPLWRYELQNVLWAHVRAGRMAKDVARDVARLAFDRLGIISREADPLEVLDLAATTGLTAYDCQYLVVARTLGLTLYTYDKAILRASPGIALRPDKEPAS
jgi:predicted nucleic acid-binding protein